MDPMHRPPKQGILLFEESPLPHRGSQRSTPSSKPSSGSGRARNTPHNAGNMRTNFTSSQPPFDPIPAYLEPPYDSFESPAMLDPAKLPPKRDFGPPAPEFNSLFVIMGALLGIGLGIGMFYLRVPQEVQQLIALPGDLFVRALRCLIVPLVLCCMSIVVAETVALGRSSIMRWRTLVPYATSSILATIQGMGLAILFVNYFNPDGKSLLSHSTTVDSAFKLTMKCMNGQLLSSSINGTLACVAENTTNYTSTFSATKQTIESAATLASVNANLSLVDQIVAICNTIVPVNIFASLVDGSLLSIVMFSIPLGLATAHSVQNGQESFVLPLLKQIRNIFLLLLNGLLKVTPIAVIFLMGGSIARFNTDDLSKVMSQLGYLLMAFMIGAISHAFIVLPLAVYLWTKSNPYKFIQQLIPAYVFAFGCSSSMATMPVAIECIQRAKVSRSLAHITMPFGTPVNLNASGFYYPLAVVFMANMGGYGDLLTPAKYVIIFFMSLLGCMGTAPVPSAALVYSITLWKTCFGTDLPPTFALIITADVLLDRVSTMLNVNGNAMVTRILADQIDETFEAAADEHA